MSNQEMNELAQALYNGYVNHLRKRDKEPMPYWMFKARIVCWKEW